MKCQGPLTYNQCSGPVQLIVFFIYPSTSQVQSRLFASFVACDYQLMKDLSFRIHVLRIPVEEFISICQAPLYYNHALLPFKFPSRSCCFFVSPSLSKVALVKIRAMWAHKQMGYLYLPVYTIDRDDISL